MQWHRRTGDEATIVAAHRAASWLVSVQEAHGAWRKWSYLGVAATYQAHLSCWLADLGVACADDRLLASASRNLDWVLEQRNASPGWFDRCGFTDREHVARTADLHTIGYTLAGVLHTSRVLARPDGVEAVVTAGPSRATAGDPRPEAAAATTPPSEAADLNAWLREYAEERLNSRLMDERRSIPPRVLLDFGNRGLLGLQVPRAQGGIGLSYGGTLNVLEQLGAIDLTLAMMTIVHNVLGLRPILHHAGPALAEEWVPRLASGRELAAFAITEPGLGVEISPETVYDVPVIRRFAAHVSTRTRRPGRRASTASSVS